MAWMDDQKKANKKTATRRTNTCSHTSVSSFYITRIPGNHMNRDRISAPEESVIGAPGGLRWCKQFRSMARVQTRSTRLAGPDCMKKSRMGRMEAKLPAGAGAGSPFPNDYQCTSRRLARSAVTCRSRRACGCCRGGPGQGQQRRK